MNRPQPNQPQVPPRFYQAIQDLWGMGLTVVPRLRHADPFYVPDYVIPADRGYQWMHLEHDKVWIETGWSPVPYERHAGMFAPYGTGGNIEVQGMGLFDKPKFEIERERSDSVKKAQGLMQDWADRMGAQGFGGGARVVGMGEADAVVTEIKVGEAVETRIETIARPQEKTVELVSAIPKDMTAYIGRIFAERDRIKEELIRPDRSLVPCEIADKFYEAIEADKTLPWWPTLHAIILPYAIENVRKAVIVTKTEEGTS